MAASMRLLVRRVVRLSHTHFTVTAAGGSSQSSCRCCSNASGDRSTHFGFETVSEAEKAQKGE